MIQLQAVTKQFAGRRNITALDCLSLEIVRGELVSIVGPSGSGKSTLLNLIGGLDRVTGGSILIDGQDLARLSDDELTRVRRDKIGFIFQFFEVTAVRGDAAGPRQRRQNRRQTLDVRAHRIARRG